MAFDSQYMPYREYWQEQRYVECICCLMDASNREEQTFTMEPEEASKALKLIRKYARYVDIEEGRYIQVSLYPETFIIVERIYSYYCGAQWDEQAYKEYYDDSILGDLEKRDNYYKSMVNKNDRDQGKI